MKKIKKALALILMLSIFGAMLSGCSSKNSESDASSSPTESTSPSADDAEATTSVEAVEFDYDASSKFLDDDELVMSVNGSDVYWKEYFYWLKYGVTYSSYYGTLGDWNAEITSIVNPGTGETLTASDAVKQAADHMVTYYKCIEQFANDMGLEVTEEDKEELKQSFLENYESEEALEEEIAAAYLSMDLLVYINTVLDLYNQAMIELYGENGSKVTDEEVATYVEENSYYQAKHILFTFDSDEEKDSVKEEAESVAEQLKDYSGDDFAAYFQELSDEHNADTGQSSYPNGYLYTSGSMVPEFEDAVEALEDNGVSDVVESTYGYHVIVRVPVDYDASPMSDTNGYTLRYYAAASLLSDQIAEKQDSAEIVYGDAYKKIVPPDVFVVAEKTADEESATSPEASADESPAATDAESSN